MNEVVSRIEIVKSAMSGWQVSVQKVAVGLGDDGKPFLAGATTSIVYTVGTGDDVSALVKGMIG